MLQPTCADNEQWFREYWQAMFKCSSDTECQAWQSLNQAPEAIQWVWGMTSRVYDGVYVYARAMHQAINETCPDAFKKSANQSAIINNCLDGQKMLKYLKVELNDRYSVRCVLIVKQQALIRTDALRPRLK
jgi:hypothetical protein